MKWLFPSLRRVSVVLTLLLCADGLAVAATPGSAMSPTLVQTALSKRGVGRKVRIVEVDGSVVNGVINSIDAYSFQITPKDATHPALIRYGQVAAVKRVGLTRNGKLALGTGMAAVGAVALASVSYAHGFN